MLTYLSERLPEDISNAIISRFDKEDYFMLYHLKEGVPFGILLGLFGVG